MDKTMTKTKKLIAAIENAGYEWRSYSGRGMYGKECVGVTIRDKSDLIDLADAAKIAGKPCTDDMGLGTIAYWPNVEAPKKIKSTTVYF